MFLDHNINKFIFGKMNTKSHGAQLFCYNVMHTM